MQQFRREKKLNSTISRLDVVVCLCATGDVSCRQLSQSASSSFSYMEFPFLATSGETNDPPKTQQFYGPNGMGYKALLVENLEIL